MIVNSDTLALTYAGVKTDFDLAYAAARPNQDWNKIATEIDTTLPVQNYAFLGQGVQMEKFRDRVREQELTPYVYTIADEIYKGALKIERKALEDDQYGLIRLRTTNLADAAARHWNKLAYQALLQGFSTVCYDGQYFFDNDHTANGVTFSNVTSAVLSDSSLQAAEAAMMAFTDDKGEFLNVVPNVLVVGPKNARLAADLTGSPVVVIKPGDGTVGTGASGGTNFANYFAGRYIPVVSPYFTGNQWALLDTTKGIKPIILQSRSDVPISTETDMLDGAAQMKEEYMFAVRGRYAAGYGLWQFGYGSNAA